MQHASSVLPPSSSLVPACVCIPLGGSSGESVYCRLGAVAVKVYGFGGKVEDEVNDGHNMMLPCLPLQEGQPSFFYEDNSHTRTKRLRCIC